MKLFSPWMILGVVLAVGSAFGGGTALGVKYAKGQAAREEVLIARAAEAAEMGAAREIAKIKVTNKTIKEKVEVQTREVPIYNECRLTADIERLLNDALAGRAPTDTPDNGVVPGADTPAGK